MPHNQNYVIAYNKGYRVDTFGNVISPHGGIRKLDINDHGYYRFSIRHNGGMITITAHQLQA